MAKVINAGFDNELILDNGSKFELMKDKGSTVAVLILEAVDNKMELKAQELFELAQLFEAAYRAMSKDTKK